MPIIFPRMSYRSFYLGSSFMALAKVAIGARESAAEEQHNMKMCDFVLDLFKRVAETVSALRNEASTRMAEVSNKQ